MASDPRHRQPLRHEYEYGRVQDEIIWDVAMNKLATLGAAIDAMQRSLDADGNMK